MAYTRQWAFAALGLCIGVASVAGCERREQEARGVTREPGGAEAEPGAQQAPGAQQQVPGAQQQVPGAQQQAPGAQQQAEGGAQQQAQSPTQLQDRIASARCQREQRCGNLGTGKPYENMEACMNATRTRWRGELTALQCPGAQPKQDKLDECVKEIQDKACGESFQSLSDVKECQATEVCGVR
ncbi:MAG: hypothetical protein IT372_31285 [Polyangiaceae bacterium]|nr:hypothetical protein [Polyangiaceae bacterium]